MPILKSLLEAIVCPKCKGGLNWQSDSDSLLCDKCQIVYPIREGVPLFFPEEALDLKEGGKSMAQTSRGPVAYFKVNEGPNADLVIKLPIGCCKAVGRSLDDANKTQVFSLESTVPLDDFTKKVVMNFISKRTGKAHDSPLGEGGLGSFKRLPDLVLNDPSVSRLHAMLFHDDAGAGILDLASRNGTYVNGQEIESKTLKEGDLIEIGSTRLAFSMQSLK